MLLVVLFLVYNDVAVDEEVVEKKKLARLWFLPAGLGQDSLAHQHAPFNNKANTFNHPAPTSYSSLRYLILLITVYYCRYGSNMLVTWNCKRLTGRPEASLHQADPAGVGLRVDCNTIHI